jgi:hypothetical protein
MTTKTIITVRSEGRRHYIAGLPYELKDTAKEAGCRWDSDRKMWWSGKSEIAIEVVQRAQSRQAQALQQREERSVSAQASAAARGVLAGHPAKLPSGDWGVKVFSQARPDAGAKITVTTSRGKSWETSVESVLGGEAGGWLVTTPPRQQRGGNRGYRKPWSQLSEEERDYCRAKAEFNRTGDYYGSGMFDIEDC